MNKNPSAEIPVSDNEYVVLHHGYCLEMYVSIAKILEIPETGPIVMRQKAIAARKKHIVVPDAADA